MTTKQLQRQVALNTLQSQKIALDKQETASTIALTQADITELATKKGITSATLMEIKTKLGLEATEKGLWVSTKALTVADLEQAIATLSCDEATKTNIKSLLLEKGAMDSGAKSANLLSKALGLIKQHPYIAAITVAVIALSAAFDLATTSTEEARKKAEESAQELEQLQSDITSINSELETTGKRIDEILAKDEITLADEEELKKLQAQNDELERELRIKEALEKNAKKEASDDATEVFTSVPDNGFWKQRGTTVYYEEDRGAGGVGTYQDVDRNRMQASLDYMEQIKEVNKEIAKLKKEQDAYDVDSLEFKSIQNQIDSKTELLQAVQGALDSYIKDFQSEDDNLVRGISEDTDAVMDMLDEIYEKYDFLMNYGEGTAITLDERLKDKFANNEIDSSTTDSNEFISKWIDSLSEEQQKKLLTSEIAADTVLKAAEKDISHAEKIAKDAEQKVSDANENLANELLKIDEWGLSEYKDEIINQTLQSKFGNVDMDKRIIIEWSDALKKTYQKELESWDYEPLEGGIDTVFGGSQFFGINDEEVEVAFTPIMNIDDKAIFLGRETVYNYIARIIELANKDGQWTIEEILSLDKEGIKNSEIYEDGKVVGTQLIKGIIAGVGEGSDDSPGAYATSLLMHFMGKFGAWQLGQDELKTAQENVDNLSTSFESLNSLTKETKEESSDIIVPATITGSVKQIAAELEPQFAKLGELYKSIFYTDNGFDANAIDNSMLEDLRASFLELEESLGIEFDSSAIEDFNKVLADGVATKEEAQQAFNDLATAWFYSTTTLDNLNSTTADAIVQQLEQLGVTNAQEVVNAALAEKEVELAATKLYLKETTEDLSSATTQEILEFVKEQIAVGNASEAMYRYYLQKVLADASSIKTADDVQNLINLAKAAGLAGEQLAVVTRMAGLFAQANAAFEAGNFEYAEKLNAQAYMLKSQLKKDLEVEPLKIEDFMPKDTDDAGKDAADAYVEAFGKELEKLQDLRDRGKITEKEYLDALRALYEKYFKDKENYLDEYEKYEHEYLEGMKSLYEKAFSAITSIIDKRIDALEKEKDAAIESIEAERDARKEELEVQKEALELQIESIDKRIDAKNAEIDKINEANEAKQRELDLSKALYEQEKSQAQRTRLVYKDGHMVYDNDPTATRDAKENVDEAKDEIRISKIEDEISVLEKRKTALEDQQEALDKQMEQLDEFYEKLIANTEASYDAMISGLEEYKSRYEELHEIEERAEYNAILEQLGIAEEDILSMSEETFAGVKDNYLALLSDMYSGNDQMIQSIGEIAGMDMSGITGYLERTQEGVDALGESNVDGLTESFAELTNYTGEVAKNVDAVREKVERLKGQKAVIEIETLETNAKYGLDGNPVWGKAFADGGEIDKSETVLVGEKKPEIYVTSDGKFSLIDKPTLIDANRGDTVISGDDTEDALKGRRVVLSGKAFFAGTGNTSQEKYSFLKNTNPMLYKGLINLLPENTATMAINNNILKKLNDELVKTNNVLTQTNANGKNNMQPAFQITGDINITCPGVTSVEVMEQIKSAFRGLSLNAYQHSHLR